MTMTDARSKKLLADLRKYTQSLLKFIQDAEAQVNVGARLAIGDDMTTDANAIKRITDEFADAYALMTEE